jgi:hypothetical protein
MLIIWHKNDLEATGKFFMENLFIQGAQEIGFKKKSSKGHER